MTNAINYIALNYSNLASRSEVEELNLANKSLEGELDFTGLGFTNLKKLDLSNNNLTKLTLANPQQLTYLDVSGNKLTYLNTSELNNLELGEIKNNPLPEQAKKDFLIKRWNYYKQVEIDYPDKLVPGIMELVIITDLDNYIINYDFKKQGNHDYHQIIGNGYTYLDEYSLELLSQHVLARALIKQNELVNGTDEEYAKQINNLARQFQKAEEMTTKYELAIMQRELWKVLNKNQDLSAVFQKQLKELTTLLDSENMIAGVRRSRKTFSVSIPNYSIIKSKIAELQNLTTEQQAEIVRLKQSLQDKETSRVKMATDIVNLKKAKQEDIQRLSVDYEAKIKSLTDDVRKSVENLELTEYNEQECRKKISELEAKLTELEEQKITGITEVKERFNKVIKEKDKIIDKYHELKKELDQAQSDLQTQEQAIKKLKGEDRINYWKWGLVGLIVLAIVGLGWWGYRKWRN